MRRTAAHASLAVAVVLAVPAAPALSRFTRCDVPVWLVTIK